MPKKTPQKPYTLASQLKSEEDVRVDVHNIKRFKKRKIEFYNYPVAFDIEVTSFEENGEPRATMYVWQMCLGDSEQIILGRTWEEFLHTIKLLRKKFHLKKDRVLVIYIHNLSYEAQFIRKMFEWEKVFATEKREPLFMRTKFGIEFRCSYRLSGYGLATLATTLTRHEGLEKKIGDLDYSIIRNSKTPLTDKEIGYCIADVQIVCAYISERLEIDGNITKLPYTKTGYTRNDCKVACYGEDHRSPKYYRYRELMKSLTMEPEEYKLMRNAFAGGFTHANAFYVNQVLEDVTSIDFTSDYPYCLTLKYPWSKGILCYPDIEEVMKDLTKFGWILDLELYDVESTTMQDDYISYSRCVDCVSYSLNNGRVNKAKYIHIVVTSIDLDIILKTYKCYGGIKIIQAYKYYLAYLPTEFITTMLSYYGAKTKLKNVDGREEEYMNGKENLNACYGMVCTSPVRPDITYINDKWGKREIELDKGISKYNNNPNRFLPWIVGCFCTAYARHRLWDGILECGSDYVYSDTDSIKLLNYEAHKEYFEEYNAGVVEHLKTICDYHKIPWDMVAPKTIKGEEKILGVWDYDGHYKRFKTLGAKRYMVENDSGEISLTVSGLNKHKAIPYLLETYGREKIFDVFTDDEWHVDSLVIPPGHSGRMISTYIDEETEGELTDYLGNTAHYHELSSVNLSNSTYTLSLSKDYIQFLFGIRKEII